MNEVAWCYLEGFGTKKDKVSSVSFMTARTPQHEHFRLCPTKRLASCPVSVWLVLRPGAVPAKRASDSGCELLLYREVWASMRLWDQRRITAMSQAAT
jgi:hypothetical protein